MFEGGEGAWGVAGGMGFCVWSVMRETRSDPYAGTFRVGPESSFFFFFFLRLNMTNDAPTTKRKRNEKN